MRDRRNQQNREPDVNMDDSVMSDTGDSQIVKPLKRDHADCSGLPATVLQFGIFAGKYEWWSTRRSYESSEDDMAAFNKLTQQGQSLDLGQVGKTAKSLKVSVTHFAKQQIEVLADADSRDNTKRKALWKRIEHSVESDDHPGHAAQAGVLDRLTIGSFGPACLDLPGRALPKSQLSLQVLSWTLP